MNNRNNKTHRAAMKSLLAYLEKRHLSAVCRYISKYGYSAASVYYGVGRAALVELYHRNVPFAERKAAISLKRRNIQLNRPASSFKGGNPWPTRRKNKERKMIHKITIPMISRDALLIEGEEADRHRGVWFYDPVQYPEMVAGDIVWFFVSNEQKILIAGSITEVGLLPADFPKFCSGLNSRGFRWKDSK